MHPQPCPSAVVFLLRQSASQPSLADPGVAFEEEPQESEQEERLIRCRQCRRPVTSSACAIAVGGRHRHTFPNPTGIVFEIGCFKAASGCACQGRPTPEFSWFPGFSWCFAFCAGCRSHLGWHYSSPAGPPFYGLILGSLLIGE